MTQAIEQYLKYLDGLARREGEYHLVTKRTEKPSMWVVDYRNVPEDGHLTAFTFGLSSVNHSDWKYGRPELVLSIQSDCVDWGLAIGFLGSKLRGKCPFSYGTVLRFGDQITAESEMDAFLVFVPTVLTKEQAHVELSDRTINIVQAYPIYGKEIPLIERNGAEAFFMQPGIDFSNVRRPALRRVKETKRLP